MAKHSYSTPRANVPPEPHEPWRVDRRRHRTSNRRWVTPLVTAGLAAVSTAAVFQYDGTSHAPAAPLPSHTAGTMANQNRSPAPTSAGRSTAPKQREPVAQQTEPSEQDRKRTEDDAASRQNRADMDGRSRRVPHSNSTGRDTPREATRPNRRPRTSKPRHVEEAPDWIDDECRRRYPDDRTRRTACITALRSTFGR